MIYNIITVYLLVVFIVWIFGFINLPIGCGLSFCNPKVLYTYWKVNLFGAYFLGILFTIIFLPISIFYWLYKLCTVGRDEK